MNIHNLEINKGDSSSYTLNFTNDITGLIITFLVKENKDSIEYVIEKTAVHQDIHTAIVVLNSTDTIDLEVKTYVFGIKVEDSEHNFKTLMKGDFIVSWGV
ncbi:MAG: hypothetical protein ABFD61_00240 [Chloroherpetonaceae bacterium]|jgi:hypothetical protein